jgi:hypothetical protein
MLCQASFFIVLYEFPNLNNSVTRSRDLFITFQFSLSPTATNWKSATSVFSGRVQSASTFSYDSQNGVENWDVSDGSRSVVCADMGPVIYGLPMDVPHEARYATIGNNF